MREQMIELIETDSDFLDAIFEDKRPKPKKPRKQMKPEMMEMGRPPLKPPGTRNGTFNSNFEGGRTNRKSIRSNGFKIVQLQKDFAKRFCYLKIAD